MMMERILTLLKENLKLVIGAVVVFIVVVLFITLLLNRQSTKVLVNGQSFNVKVADSEEEKQKGLSGTKNLEDNEGMLFLFDEPGDYSFWMKDMEFPIDIIYINDDKVVSVFENAQPATGGDLKIYKPQAPADKVLELKAGHSSKFKINEGASVQIENL